ncbi:tRNA (guanine-N(7)-)-methyltransferase TrmB [Clostridium aceticum]|uniref:tRNA (guanine-N(7)-)-methyltransferase n=1 Tax=Clostridium aceticum TaxID=84022 RepID=A0A0D8IBP2_9CLOT|nr:tRNA (guanosine(46)-N7)-methyltransferase TrmB [Clostridium aceticum]AKL94769.1 tRNA (guanine-N(7)-)-methyltransferase TrmB [Clostridium aceticum]KJF27715.1 tRNA (guanine-N7)-methyltransferase [Clostridium aceticum]
MRRRKKPGSKEKLLSYEDYLCKEPEKYKGRWKDYFHEEKLIHVELGTGRGQFITTLAEMNPHICYIGIEIKEEVLLRAVEKAVDKGLKNICFLWCDINKIHDIFDKNELSRIYINFCDPWPKKRWVQRRLTHRNFLEKYKYILGENGDVHFKTDNEKLFEFSLNELSYENFRLNNITFDLHHSETNDGITTEYEDKFSALGMKIYRCEGVKRN